MSGVDADHRGERAEDGVRSGGWTRDEVDTLIRLWGRGEETAEIAKTLGRPRNAVSIKATRLKLPPKRHAKKVMTAPPAGRPPEARVRPCLCCTKPFFSAGKFNRICDPCKSGQDAGGDYVVQFRSAR